MSKPGAAGYAKFITSEAVRKLKEARLPDVEKEWAGLPLGFRQMLYRNAGLDVARLERGLSDLSQDDRRKLQAANVRLAEVQAKAARVLVAAVFSKPRA